MQTRTIYKYQLKTTDRQTISVPILISTTNFKKQVLKVDVQKGEPCIWCLVDTERESREVKIRIVGTGHPMPDLYQEDYLGSYMLQEESLVFHVFLEDY